MKICLVFTPFYTPNSFPLGIAYLKSYLEKNIPGSNVKNLDLNVKFFNRLLQEPLEDFCENCQSRKISCLPTEVLFGLNVKKLKLVLKNKLYSKKEFLSFLVNSLQFKSLFALIVSCFQSSLKDYLEKDMLNGKYLKILKDDVKTIIDEKADIIGFSIMNEKNLAYSLSLAKLIKATRDTPIIFGGALMSYLDANEILNAFKFVDYIIQGEGELAMTKFIETFPTTKAENIPNLVYRKNGRICSNKKAYISDLDAVPFPDFSDFNQTEYLSPETVIPILSLRGCYWNRCSFCIHYSYHAKKIRCRSIKNTIDEIEYQSEKLGAKNFLFVDETVPPKRLEQLSHEILRRKISITYGAKGIRPENGFTYPLLKKAYQSGLRTIYLGVESVTQRILDKMEKGTDVEVILRIIEDCYKIGIKPLISYMIAFPSQTEEELEQEKYFLKKYEIDTACVMFRLLKGSPIAKEPKRFHIKPLSSMAIFDVGGKQVHSRVVNFLHEEGISCQKAADILINSKFSLNRYALDEITNIFLSRYKFKISELEKNRLKYKENLIRHAIFNLLKAAKVLSNKIHNSRIYFSLGSLYFSVGKYREAIESLKKAEKNNPDSLEINALLFKSYAASGKIKGNEEALKKSWASVKSSGNSNQDL